MFDIADFVFDAFNNGELVILVFLDYSKAFDCANHKLILAKVRALRFMDSAPALLESYLLDPKQKITLENKESDWGNIVTGAPQGSILGLIVHHSSYGHQRCNN